MAHPNPYGVRFISREEFIDLAKSSTSLPTDIALYQEFIPEMKVATDGSRKMTFAVSTEDVDRDRDVIKADGWKLKAFKKNPVVLWAHDYRDLPIAKAVKIGVEDQRLVSVADFVPKEVYEFAETVFQMVKLGFLNAASVGFKPLEHAFNEDRRGIDILKSELLEWSVVPVPANAEALVQFRAIADPAISQSYLKWCKQMLDEYDEESGLWIPRQRLETLHRLLAPPTIAIANDVIEKAVPPNVSTELADEGEAWSAPTLADFTSESWDNLSATKRNRIAGHFAYSRVLPPEKYGDLKLPHHRASDGAVVWRGCAAAMAVLMGGRGGVEAEGKRAIFDHLAAHYRAFEKEPPEFRAEQPAESQDHASPKSLSLDHLDAAIELHQMHMNEPGTATPTAQRAMMAHLKKARQEAVEAMSQMAASLHPLLAKRAACGICDPCLMGSGPCEEKQEGFEIQTLLFPKRHWDSANACRAWMREHEFRSDKLDETENAYRFRQREPGDFARLRTICVMPHDAQPGEARCRIQAVGGPRKSADPEPVLLLDEEPVLILSEEEFGVDEILVNMDQLHEVLEATVERGLASVVASAIRSELNYASGRLDDNSHRRRGDPCRTSAN